MHYPINYSSYRIRCVASVISTASSHTMRAFRLDNLGLTDLRFARVRQRNSFSSGSVSSTSIDSSGAPRYGYTFGKGVGIQILNAFVPLEIRREAMANSQTCQTDGPYFYQGGRRMVERKIRRAVENLLEQRAVFVCCFLL